MSKIQLKRSEIYSTKDSSSSKNTVKIKKSDIYKDEELINKRRKRASDKLTSFADRYTALMKDAEKYLTRAENEPIETGVTANTKKGNTLEGEAVKSSISGRKTSAYSPSTAGKVSSKAKAAAEWADSITKADTLKSEAGNIKSEAAKLLKELEGDKSYMSTEMYNTYKELLSSVANDNSTGLGDALTREAQFRKNYTDRDDYLTEKKNNEKQLENSKKYAEKYKFDENTDILEITALAEEALDRNAKLKRNGKAGTPTPEEEIAWLESEVAKRVTLDDVEAWQKAGGLEHLVSKYGYTAALNTVGKEGDARQREAVLERDRLQALLDEYSRNTIGSAAEQGDYKRSFVSNYGNPKDIRAQIDALNKEIANYDLYSYLARIPSEEGFRKYAKDYTAIANAKNGLEAIRKNGASMTNTEAAIYNYLRDKNPDQAEDFLELLSSDLYDRSKNEKLKTWAEIADKSPILSSGVSVLTSLGGGLEYLAEDLIPAIAKYPIESLQGKAGIAERKTSDTYLTDVTNTIRGEVSKKFSNKIGEWDAGAFVYNTTMSGIDSAVSAMTLGSAGGLTLGLSAASQGSKSALEKGLTNEQAFWAGVFSGTFEMFFEEFSIGQFKVMQENPVSTFKDLIKNMAKSMGVNLLEEAATETANILYDYIAHGDLSDYAIRVEELKAQNEQFANDEDKLTDEEIKAKVWGEMGLQVVEAAASGALMGFGMTAAADVSNSIASINAKTEQGHEIIKNYGDAESVAKFAMELNGIDRATYEQFYEKEGSLLNAKANKNGEYSDSTARLAKKVYEAAIDENVKTTKTKREDLIKSLLKTNGVDSDKVSEVSREISDTMGDSNELRVLKKKYADDDAVVTVIDAIETVANEAENAAVKSATEKTFESLDVSDYNVKPEAKGIKKIADISDADATIVDSAGNEVSAYDAELTKDEAVIINGLQNIAGKVDITPETANLVLAEFKNSGVDAATYILGAGEAIRYGRFGMQDTAALASKEFAKNLPQNTQRVMLEEGRRLAKAEDDTRQAQTKKTSKKASKSKAGVVYAGEGVNAKADGSIDTSKLDTRQQANIRAIEAIAKVSPLEFHVFRSTIDADGHFSAVIDGKVYDKKAPNGLYYPGTNEIWIDLNSGLNGEGFMLWTAGHEISHYIRSQAPAQWRALAGAISEEYLKNGKDFEKMLKDQKGFYLKNHEGESITNAQLEDAAYEELISEALADMLTDGSVVEFLADVKKKDAGLWATIKKAITDLLKRWGEMLGFYKEATLQTEEARSLREIEGAFERVQALFKEAFAAANEGYTEAAENASKAIFGKNATEVNDSAVEEFGVKNQLREHEKIGEKAAKKNETTKAVDYSVLQAGIDVMNEMAEAMMPYLKQDGILPPDNPGKTIFKNGSYGRTAENTTLCVRTLTYEDFKDRVSEKLNRPLTVAESLLVSQKIYDIAVEPQCIYCYVAADRKAYDEYLGTYWKSMNKYIKALKDGGDSQSLYTEYLDGRKDTKQQQARWKRWESLAKSGAAYISQADLATKAKRDAIISKGGAFADQIKDAQRYAQSASWAKKVNDYRAYNGEILKMKADFIKQLNSEYGLRMYSFSDYTPAFIVENMQMLIDASVMKLRSLAYTKDTAYAEIFAPTGQAINVSCFAKLDPKTGEYVEDSRQGANWAKTQALRKQYKNVGAVMVATSDKMVDWALSQDWIDVVIPYHIVKTGTTIANEYAWRNYTADSADRQGNRAANIYPTEHNNDFATYKSLVEERGLTPRFSKWYDACIEGKITEAQYMKLVNEVRLPSSALSAVTPNFNLDAARESFGITKDGKVIEGGFVDKGGYMGGWYREGVDPDQEAMAVASDIEAGKTSSEVDYGMNRKAKLSARNTAPTFYSQMGKAVDGIKDAKIGAKDVVSYLKGKGVKNEEIKWSGIENFLEGKKSVTKEELQAFVASSMLDIEETVKKDNLANKFKSKAKLKKISNEIYEVYKDGKLIDTLKLTENHKGNRVGVWVPNDAKHKNAWFWDLDDALDAYNAAHTGDTKWSEYKLKGGKNYREIAFSIPNSDYTNDAMIKHWGIKTGVVAHARVQDMVVNGKKMLFIEELQSDWHNEGRKSGYEGDAKKEGPVPNAPFKDTYHEFVLKRLMRMAAEEGYDTIGWTQSDTQSARWSEAYSKAYHNTYDIRMVKFMNKEGGKWGTQVESADLPAAAETVYVDNGWSNHYDSVKAWKDTVLYSLKEDGVKRSEIQFTQDGNQTIASNTETGETYAVLREVKTSGKIWSMEITDSMRDSVLYEGQALYSQRNTPSNRSILANALESAAKDADEKALLDRYKSLISEYDEMDKELDSTNKRLKELYADKANRKKNQDEINSLKVKANKLGRQISKYDKTLLELESADALQRLLKREKSNARARQRVIDRERVEKRELRDKIRSFKKKLQSTLLRPTERKYVPAALVESMVAVCDSIYTDTQLLNDDGSINQAQAKRNVIKDKLAKLVSDYKALGEFSDPVYNGEYDAETEALLTELKDRFEGKSLIDMSKKDLEDMYEILKSIGETLRDARKLIGRTEATTVYEAADSIVDEQYDILKKRKNGRRNAVNRASDYVTDNTLSPVRNVEKMSGYNPDSQLVKQFHELEKGVRAKNFFIMNARQAFAELTTGKNEKKYNDAIYEAAGNNIFVDDRGRAFGISKMEMMQAILSYEREIANNLVHIRKSGFVFADLEQLKKGKLSAALSREYAHQISVKTSELIEDFKQILEGDKWAQDYMEAARNFFNVTAKDALNKTYMSLKHRLIAKDKNYIPFEVDRKSVVEDIGANQDVQETINSYGMLKDMKRGAAQALMISGLNNILDRHIEQVGTVHGLAIPVRDFNKIWNAKSENSPTRQKVNVQEMIEMNWGESGYKHIVQAVKDIQGKRQIKQSKVYNWIKSNYIGATFALNLSIVTKQMGSLFSSTSMLRWRDPARMLSNFLYTAFNTKKIAAEVDKYTATAWMRRQGLSDAEVYTLMTEAKKPKWWKAISPAQVAKLITAMDYTVALSLWKYAKQDVAKATGLKGEELLKATAEYYDDVVENTQSMTDVLHRPEIQKSGSIMSEVFGTFKTDLYQMAGQLKVAAGRYAANKSKENGAAVAKTTFAIVSSAVWAQAMTLLFAALRYKMNPYRDDEDKDLTLETIWNKLSVDLIGEFISYLAPLSGGEVVDLIEAFAKGETPDVLNSFTFSTVNDLASAVGDIIKVVQDGKEIEYKHWKKLAVKGLTLFGIPANNAIRAYEAFENHLKDAKNGEFFSFNAGAEKTAKNYMYGIVEAYEDGDIEDVEKRLKKAEETIENYEPAKLRSALLSAYKKGDVSRDTAEALLEKYLIENTKKEKDYKKKAEDEGKTVEQVKKEEIDNKVYWTLDKWDYIEEHGKDEGYTRYDEFYEAIDTGKSFNKVIKRYLNNGYDHDDLASEMTKHFKPLYQEMSKSERVALKNRLITAYSKLRRAKLEAEGEYSDRKIDALVKKYEYDRSDAIDEWLEE